MPPKVIIDGYNLLHTSSESTVRREELLESARNRLIEKLSSYKKIKSVSIVVVFDGWKGGMPTQSQEILKGIKIVYSRLGEEADDVIKRMITDSTTEIIIVSSDREIRDFAERHNTVSVSSSEFEKKIEMASFLQIKGCDEDEEDEEKTISTRKKGNPKRLSKVERKRRAKLKKL